MAIEAPINVIPNDVTVFVDKTLENPGQPWESEVNDYENPIKMSFTFNGDNLSWWRCEHYDAITGEAIGYSFAPRDLQPWVGIYRNGDEVTINGQVATNLWQNGNDYKYRIILYQSDSTGQPLCDMLCVTGRVVSASGSTITVETGITDIDAPYVMDGHLIGRCMIEVVSDNNGTLVKNKIPISAYSKATGVITLTEAFVGDIAEGTRYKIYRNYYKSPCYFVRCREEAALTPSARINAETGGIEVSAGFNIASEKEVYLQKYSWAIGSTRSKEIYSYHDDKKAKPDRASNDLTLDAVFPILANQETVAKLTTTSQDGYVQTAQVTLSNTIQADSNMFERYTGTNEGTYRQVFTAGLAMLLEQNRVGVKVTPAEGYENFKLWKRKGRSGHYRYVSECSESGQYIIGFDDAAEDGLEYEYVLSAEISGQIFYKVIGRIVPDYKGRAVIEKLRKDTDYFGISRYYAAGYFIFDFEIGKPSINVNDGQSVINTGNKPIVIKESGRYISGDFSAAITQMEVNGYYYELSDSNETYQRAVNFFDDSEYLIKLPERGCIIGKITSKNIKQNESGATILSFSFTQTKSNDEVIVEWNTTIGTT